MFKLGDKVFLEVRGEIGWEINANMNLNTIQRDGLVKNKIYEVVLVDDLLNKIAVGGGMYWHHPGHFVKYEPIFPEIKNI